jgi:pilus assembly protein CpaE
MSAGVNVIVYTSNEETAPELRRDLLNIDGVKIVAEIDDTVFLGQAADRFPADIVIVDLDPVPEEVLPIAGALAMERKDIDVFAISESTDGQLILSAMRAGIREFLTKPIDVDLLKIAFEKVAGAKQAHNTAGKLITVIGSAGGVGATTLAANVGVELAQLTGEGRVALVDLDHRFGQVATMLDIQPSFTIADLATNGAEIETSVIKQAMVRHESGVDILARPNTFAQADMITAGHCAGILVALQDMYDYVVVDGPNRFDVGGKAVLDVADYNLLVINLLVTSVRNLSRIVEEMRTAGFNTNRVKILCNRVGHSDTIGIPDVETMLEQATFHSVPEDWEPVSSSINMGVPLKTEFEKSRARIAIQELAMKVHDPVAFEAIKPKEKGMSGLLSKMFHKG